jgi:hypothetical protein
MPKKEHRTFTSQEAAELAGCTLRRVQQFLELAPLEPAVPGKRGKGNNRRYSLMQVVAVCYGNSCIEEGCHHDFAYRACKWIASSYPAFVRALAEDRTLFALGADGSGRLVEPEPATDRRRRLQQARLSLLVVHRQVLARVMRLAEAQAKVEKARAQRARGGRG